MYGCVKCGKTIFSAIFSSLHQCNRQIQISIVYSTLYTSIHGKMMTVVKKQSVTNGTSGGGRNLGGNSGGGKPLPHGSGSTGG